MGLPHGSAVKNPPAVQEMQEVRVQCCAREDPLRKKWQPTAVFLPEKYRLEEPGGL